MPSIKRIVLDVLKPHQPNALDCALNVAKLDTGYSVKITVEEVDEMTESVTIIIEGKDIKYDEITNSITTMGGSVHSIDEVEVSGTPAPEP